MINIIKHIFKKLFGQHTYYKMTIFYTYHFLGLRCWLKKTFPAAPPPNIDHNVFETCQKFDLDELKRLDTLFPQAAPKSPEKRRGNLAVDLKMAEKFFRYLEYYNISCQDKAVAEIGCGRGHFSLYAATKGAKSVTALDLINNKFLKIAGIESVDDKIREKLKFDCLDIRSTDVTKYKEKFDLVFTRDAFEHFADPKLAFENIKSMTKPGGYVLAEVGAMFNSPLGRHFHGYSLLPYIPHLFHKEVVAEFIHEKIQSKINSGSLVLDKDNYWENLFYRENKNPYLDLNEWSYLKFSNLFKDHDGFETIFVKPMCDFNYSWMLKFFPEKFKKYPAQELFTSNLLVLFKRFP